MHLLITGAAGFLGFHLADLAARRGHRLTLVDNFVRGEADAAWRALCQRPGVAAHAIDLCDRAAVATLPRAYDAVFHLAALNGTQNFYDAPLEVLRCSTLPTFHLLEHLAPAPPGRFVYTGSSESYAVMVDRFGAAVPTAEDVPLGIADIHNPRWSYATAKLHGEVLTAQGCRQLGIPFTVIRYHNAYGPRMGDKHVIPDFLMRAGRGEFALYGHADTRSFLFADDAVAATLDLGLCAAAAGEVVNVGSAEEIRIRDLGLMMMDVCGFRGEIALHPSPPGSVPRRAPDITKLIRLLGSRPTVSLRDGLRRTAEAYLARPLAAAA